MASAVRVYHFRCPDCGECKTKLVGVTNPATKPTIIEAAKQGHAMELERIEER
jgi:hypothetical protein